MTTEPTKVLPPNIVAYVIDNTVVQTLFLDDRMAAVVLSKPEVVDITELGKEAVRNGDIYNPETGTFSRPTE